MIFYRLLTYASFKGTNKQNGIYKLKVQSRKLKKQL